MRFLFEAMDASGREVRDTVEAETEEAAQAAIRQMGYFVTKIERIQAKKRLRFPWQRTPSQETLDFLFHAHDDDNEEVVEREKATGFGDLETKLKSRGLRLVKAAIIFPDEE